MSIPSELKKPLSTLQMLAKAFPVIREQRPLALGIHLAIIARMPEVPEKDVRLALKQHTASTRYLKTLSNSDVRYDLDGNPAGVVEPEQRQRALDTVLTRLRQGAERRRAELIAKKQVEELAQRQEKLLKLAQKFNNR